MRSNRFLVLVSCVGLVACGSDGGNDDPATGGQSAGGTSSGGTTSGGASSGGASSGGASSGGTSSGGGGNTGPVGTADFDTRCSAPGVVRCVGFDAASDIAGTFGSVKGILSGASTPELDASMKASGTSSLLFTVPSNSGSDTSGSYFTNFSDDLSLQFDGNATFFVQWRQRFSSEHLETDYEGSGGFKLAIIGVGDQPGCSESNAINIDNGGNCASSCTELETVVQDGNQRGFPQMYNSCSGSASHGPYDPFEEAFGAIDFKLQNARPEPFCLYSQSQSGYFPPSGNCFGFVANEWMTFQVEVKTGPRTGDEFENSEVRLWVAREGQPSELVIDWGPYNLTAGEAGKNLRFGKVWLLPYQTGKSSAQAHPTGYTWYDELIISTSRIDDPA
jgi:hypothetical protein